MGYLLREAFRTLCGMNRWSYAVFWKIACQNPRLLIWEDYFYEPLLLPVTPQSSRWNNGEMSGAQSGDTIELLIKEMMANNQICIVGEGMIGRAAFTGNYQWFFSSSFGTHAHPPEVSNEMQHQFSAGIQTVAIVPVPPHGVVQLGSSLPIMENLGFLNDVKSLILQLGCIPGALFSTDSVERTRANDYCHGDILNVTTADNELDHPNPFFFESCKQLGNDSHSSKLINGQFLAGFENTQNNAPFQSPHQPHILAEPNGRRWQPRIANPSKAGFPLRSQLDRNAVRAEVIPSNPNMAPNRFGVSVGANSSINDQGAAPSLSSQPQSGCRNGDMTKLEGIPLFNLSDQLMAYATQVLSGSSIDRTLAQSELSCQRDTVKNTASVEHTRFGHLPKKHKSGNSPVSSNVIYEDVSLEQSMGNGGNDLFDIFGVDMKNKLFGGKLSKGRLMSSADIQGVGGDRCSVGDLSESGVFSVTCTDNLLDAVVSGALSTSKQTSDDNMSCKTTLRKISSCSVPSSSCRYSQSVKSDQVQGDIIGFPRPQKKDGTVDYDASEEPTCSNSWVEQGCAANEENSVLTGHSKKPDGPAKPNRKRVKPGENPRPRPKDRQLIQDRLKELREIVPNGAKCSIDALLERTVKHMQFLQGVTKHGDKLKHIGESRINNEKGRLLSKDKTDGGATYAFEIGSDSMFCPVIVEDLNPPRQFHVEMFCEEQGFFLEIADMIRGIGLTILKGVLESRNGKTRARFAVEATRDVTRMEIFLSLVHLFEETIKRNSSSGNAFDENPMAHNNPFTFNTQPSVVPATGMQQ